MRVLFIKMSSLGDVVHALPAVTDACAALPGLQVDWLVEEGFAAIARWHPGVTRVIPIALRRWRSAPWHYRQEWSAFFAQLRSTHYDLIIDVQGLLKSALVALLANGSRAGFDRRSAREPLASLFYQRRFKVAIAQHAVQRARELLAQALNYAVPDGLGTFGIAIEDAATTCGALPNGSQGNVGDPVPYVVFLHGTSWRNKHWPGAQWRELAALAVADGYEVRVPGGTPEERQAAARIVAGIPGAEVLPEMSLVELGGWLAQACGIAAVDTGLAHLGAAFGVPTQTLHGPTNAQRTGIYGSSCELLAPALPCAPCGKRTCIYVRASSELLAGGAPPCMQGIAPQRVWQALRLRMRPRALAIEGNQLRDSDARECAR